jgi:eukaryotic-like serine/threonine-protein kinase
LAEVPDITHRDLKPANVLLHEGRWKIADLGIARFVEDTTSSHTLKGFLSRPYAAPEQWQEERATGATDIYALGCVAHALASGSPPFPGPTPEDFKRQHLEESPPPLEGEPPHLRSLVSQMLRKNQALRPNAARVMSQLTTIHESPTTPPSVAALAAAGALIAEKEGREEADLAARAATEATRRSIAREAISSLHEVAAGLLDRIQTEAPSAKRAGDMVITLGAGTVAISVGRDYIEPGAFERSGWDVVAGGRITLKQEGTSYRGRSASLWFTDLGQRDTFRWYEVPYMRIFSHEARWDYPFALDDVPDADPRAIEDEDFDTFCERWMGRLALAARGTAQHARNAPRMTPSDTLPRPSQHPQVPAKCRQRPGLH